MTYLSALYELVGRFDIPVENITRLTQSEPVDRFALIFQAEEDDTRYWINLYPDEAQALDDALTEKLDEDNGWTPVYLVDLHDLSAREIVFEVYVGLTQPVNIETDESQ
jgi:hypothetical protein